MTLPPLIAVSTISIMFSVEILRNRHVADCNPVWTFFFALSFSRLFFWRSWDTFSSQVDCYKSFKNETASVDTIKNRTPLTEAKILLATKARSTHLTKLTNFIRHIMLINQPACTFTVFICVACSKWKQYVLLLYSAKSIPKHTIKVCLYYVTMKQKKGKSTWFMYTSECCHCPPTILGEVLTSLFVWRHLW